MSVFIELKIEVSDAAQTEILIALLLAAGAAGFEEEKNVLTAFVAEENYSGAEIEQIIEKNSLKYSKSIIKETNWNQVWEANFEPVTVDKFCCIRADFHEPNYKVQYDIIITPKMSFGTGHHATTYMMLQAMETIDVQNKDIFDFGTGTGVLSILAEKCGARSVTAIDNDEWSINNAIENFNVNNCHKVLLSKSERFSSNSSYDIILVNINRNIILQNMEHIKQHLSKQGVVLMSGLITGDEAVITQQAKRHHLKIKEKLEMSGWICLLMVNG